ncbi:MAG TPA: HdeD family acid-resistance protein [Thermoguttaceae bacterium]|nr:HdeD family acid-resistance protein [Thermoguttaceae bacterium]
MSGESQHNVSNTQSTGLAHLQENWGWFLALGIGMITVGTLAIVFSGLATLSATIVLGWTLVLGGIVQGLHAFFVRNWSGFFMQCVAAFLYVLVGFMVLANPVGAVLMLTLLLGAFFLFEGIVKVMIAFQLRPAENWYWLFFSGLVSLVLSAVIWMNWPGDALWVVGLLLGVNILFSGWSTVMFAMGLHAITCPWFCGGKNRHGATPSI